MLGEVEMVGRERWENAMTISVRGDSYRLKDKLKSGVVKPTTAGT